MVDRAALAALEAEIVACRRCPRLVAWREQVAVEKVARYADEPYWGRPLPGFGDPEARVLIVGLAPAAHGGNRTGRVFTGDRSGDFLWTALHETGFADRGSSRRADDGLTLRDAYIAAAVRCAPPLNRPTNAERDNCAPFLVRELALLENVRVIVPLGGFGWDAVLRTIAAAGSSDASSEAPLRPRGGGRDRAVPARRLVPPEPAEHVHRPADGADAGRRDGPRRGRLQAARDRPTLMGA